MSRVFLSRCAACAAAVVLAGGRPAPAQEPPGLAEEVRELKELVRRQGEQLSRLQALVESQQQQLAATAAAASQAQATAAATATATEEAAARRPRPILELGKGAENLRLTGDLRVRYERAQRDIQGAESSRERWLPQVRLGLLWTVEPWEVGVGMASGGESATSANDTWSDSSVFKTGDLRLDYAYARRRWQDLTLIVGQQKNPFIGTWAVWDSDVRPAGITGQYARDGWSATIGGYNVRHYGYDEANAYLTAAQLGLDRAFGDFRARAAAAWYHFTRATVDPNTPTTGDKKAPQPVPDHITDDDYTFSLGSLYAEAAYRPGTWSATVFGELTRNFAATGAISQVGDLPAGCRPEREDTAWVLGLKLGLGAFTADWAYAHVEADSVYGQLNDATWGSPFGGTDVEGHVFGIGYALAGNLTLSARVFLVEPIARRDRQDGRVYTLDAAWSF